MVTTSGDSIEVRKAQLSDWRRDARVRGIDCVHVGKAASAPVHGLLLHIEEPCQVIVLQRRSFAVELTAVLQPEAAIAEGGQRNTVSQRQGGIGDSQVIHSPINRFVVKAQIER